MIISVHLPKTAGTSFAAALQQHFGEKLLHDYADSPLNTPVTERHRRAFQQALVHADSEEKKIECIHGHFLPVKYLLLADTQHINFVTWMRNPVDRVLSHYYFWKNNPHSGVGKPLRHKMMTENWSLERFCLGPELRNVYGQFLFGFPLAYFSFIGITEHYQRDFAFFTKHYLHAHIEAQKINVGQSAGHYPIADSLREEIAHHHAEDVALYQQALLQRQA
ncbi:sulfotransferase family 2 domain-containing protein [Thioflexithrix psekupsensis]|uniref:Sulfotransferase family protein n=1 Tax=Thioflexithrix psekupsensis TaxID=1570016 RepID=A0A251X7R1_9GAMM|nr:sulfotransferase family 2 domain-containing protein [Thioflexithrix psekupsensis]OUD13824.1 hypothetical protein TPSD3_05615 [Thioflexithrix psekupsensis]